MMILCEFGGFQPIRRIQGWALERLISMSCVSGDVRWGLVAMALRSFTVMWAFGQRHLVLLLRNVASRAGKEACFTAEVADADSMVAAGGG